MNNKKADLSMNMIIVAALALLVLVVVSLIFITRSNVFNKQTASCETSGGYCVDKVRFGNDCQRAAEQNNYDTGRTRSDLACYDSNNKKITSYMCCMYI